MKLHLPVCVSPLFIEWALFVVILFWFEEEACEDNGGPWSEAGFRVKILKNRDLRYSTSKEGAVVIKLVCSVDLIFHPDYYITEKTYDVL